MAQTRAAPRKAKARKTCSKAKESKVGPSYGVKLGSVVESGSATLNRGHAAHSISNSHRGLRPRHLGNSAGGTGKANNSSIVQR
jgi:hypothetical protein